MGILRNASKTLFIVALGVAPATADDGKVSETPAGSTTFTIIKSDQHDLTGSESSKKTVRSQSGRATTVTRSGRSSNTIFFSPGRDVPTPSLQRDDSRPDTKKEGHAKSEVKRQRMQVTLKHSDEEPGRLNSEQPPSLVSHATGSVTRAVAESHENELSVLQPVAAEGDNPFLGSAEAAEIRKLPYDDVEIPEFSEPTFSSQSTSENGGDLLTEPAGSAVRFEPDASEIEENKIPASNTADSIDTSAVVVVPNSSGSGLPSEHTGAQRPSVELQWTRQGKLNIGQESQCSLIVTNTGGSLVRNVTVEAAIPDGIDVVSAVPAPQSGTSRWSVGDLESGESRSVDMIIIPGRRGDLALNAFVRFTGYSTSVLTVQEPMLRTAVEGPETVTVGELAGYKVRVENPGTGTAHNVVIEAQVPEGMQHRNGSVPRIHVGTLNPGESRQALLNLTARDGGQYRLAVRAIADGGIRDEADAEILISKPSLEVSVSGPETAAVGIPSDYEIIVTNTGNIPSINVRAKYQLPVDARFIRADRGGVYQKEERLIDWFVGTIQPRESASYHVTLEAGLPGTDVHRAGVKSEHTDFTMVSHSTTVHGVPELVLDIATAEPASADGEETVVRVLVQNEGKVDAMNVGLICELPAGWEFVAAEGPSGFLAESGVVIFRSIDAVKAGGEATYLIRGRCGRTGPHRIRVRVGSSSLSEPLIGEGTVTN